MNPWAPLRPRIPNSLIRIAAMLCMLALGSCNAPAVITAERLVNLASAAITILQALKQSTNETSQSLAVSLREVGAEVPKPQVALPTFQRLEAHGRELRQGQAQLRSKLRESNSAISDYLDLLKRRVRQNQTAELREEQLRAVLKREEALEQQMTRATQALALLDASIQKYDDVLNYLQVRDSLNAIDEQLAAVSRTIDAANRLNRDANSAIVQGIKIIDELRRTRGTEVAPPLMPEQSPEPYVAALPDMPANEVAPPLMPERSRELEAPALAEVPLQAAAPEQAKVPYLGISYENLTSQEASANGLAEGVGSIVRRLADGPAAAVLKVGDVIVAVDGVPVRQLADIQLTVRRHQGQGPIPMSVIRGNEQRVIRIQPEYRSLSAIEQ